MTTKTTKKTGKGPSATRGAGKVSGKGTNKAAKERGGGDNSGKGAIKSKPRGGGDNSGKGAISRMK